MMKRVLASLLVFSLVFPGAAVTFGENLTENEAAVSDPEEEVSLDDGMLSEDVEDIDMDASEDLLIEESEDTEEDIDFVEEEILTSGSGEEALSVGEGEPEEGGS